MSVTSSQPSPFGYLRREKHIERFSRVPKEKKNVCRCLEVLPVETSQGDNDYRIQLNAGERNEKPKNRTTTNPSAVGKVCDHVTVATSSSDTDFHGRPKEQEFKLSRMLTAVEELDESIFSTLQILDGAQQFCITSKAKPQGLSCHPERLYIISTRAAKQLLVATEDTSCLCLHLCGPARACCLRLLDQRREEVLRFCRPYRMDVCCMGCCLMVIKVFSSSNSLLGSVQQRWSLFSPSLTVHSSEGRRVMEIEGSWSATRCHSDQEFQVTSLNGQNIAIIWKRWPGFNEDYNMDHEFFGLDILVSLTPPEKALLLAATFLLNYMFFEMS